MSTAENQRFIPLQRNPGRMFCGFRTAYRGANPESQSYPQPQFQPKLPEEVVPATAIPIKALVVASMFLHNLQFPATYSPPGLLIVALTSA